MDEQMELPSDECVGLVTCDILYYCQCQIFFVSYL